MCPSFVFGTNVYIYDLFIPFSTLYMVLWVNTTHIILVENMLQMFHRVISRGPLSLFQLEFVSLSRWCSVTVWCFYVCPWVEMVSVDGILWFCSSGLGWMFPLKLFGGCPRVLCLGGSSRPSLGRVQTECFRWRFFAICPRVCICIPRLCGRYRLWAFSW